MRSVLALDRGPVPRVAWLVLVSCVPSLKPPAPPPEATPGITNKLSAPPPSGGHDVVVGELCPEAADGRPAVAPLLVRNVSWSDNATDLSAVIERGGVPRFVVFGADGKLAGAFDTMGVIDVGLPQEVAAGAYAGAPPCTFDAPAQAKNDPGAIATRTEEPRCIAATGGCGLAVGPVSRPDEPPELPSFVTGGACIADGQLVVDIDGAGRLESFPLAGLLDGIRGPASEWVASGGGASAPKCTPTFQLYDVKLPLAGEPGKAPDPKSAVAMDVLGVVDLDHDGHRDLVIALRFPSTRSIVVYTASQISERLELAGESTTFPHL